MEKGKFITFEGGEGSGKSTQIELTRNYLEGRGYDVDITREPGGTYTSEAIRRLLLTDKEADLHSRTELLLFAAARAQHVEERIKPYVEKGGLVLCDRFMDSSEAYQGYARQLGSEAVNMLNDFAVKDMLPDLTVLIDVPVDVGFRRVRYRGDAKDKIEQEAKEFHERLRQGYLEIAHREADRFAIIRDDDNVKDINENISQIQGQIRQALEQRLGL